MTPISNAQIFPLDVRIKLNNAAKVDPLTGPGDSVMRTREVCKAENYARQRCPHLFKEEVTEL